AAGKRKTVGQALLSAAPPTRNVLPEEGKTSRAAVEKNALPRASAASAEEKPAPAVPAKTGSPAPPAASTSAAGTLLNQTKPDGFSAATTTPAKNGLGTQDSPMTALGDSWKMLLYLLPMLLLIVGALHLLRRFQERHGQLPGGFKPTARGTGGV